MKPICCRTRASSRSSHSAKHLAADPCEAARNGSDKKASKVTRSKDGSTGRLTPSRDKVVGNKHFPKTVEK
jgi:hypothetical protein